MIPLKILTTIFIKARDLLLFRDQLIVHGHWLQHYPTLYSLFATTKVLKPDWGNRAEKAKIHEHLP